MKTYLGDSVYCTFYHDQYTLTVENGGQPPSQTIVLGSYELDALFKFVESVSKTEISKLKIIENE